MTINQKRLVRSIQLAAETRSDRLSVLKQLLHIRAAYGNGEESGYTFELALEDLWERMFDQAEAA